MYWWKIWFSSQETWWTIRKSEFTSKVLCLFSRRKQEIYLNWWLIFYGFFWRKGYIFCFKSCNFIKLTSFENTALTFITLDSFWDISLTQLDNNLLKKNRRKVVQKCSLNLFQFIYLYHIYSELSSIFTGKCTNFKWLSKCMFILMIHYDLFGWLSSALLFWTTYNNSQIQILNSCVAFKIAWIVLSGTATKANKKEKKVVNKIISCNIHMK